MKREILNAGVSLVGAKIVKAIIVGAAAAVCITAVAALAAEELIVNAGFETGELAPWTSETFKIMYGGRTGRYHAGFYLDWIKSFEGTVEQDLGRTVYPAEVRKVSLWAYGGTIEEEGNHEPAEIRIDLGTNRHYGDLYFYYCFWEYVEFPLSKLQAPFDFIRVEISIYSGYPAVYRGGLDDVSVLVVPTGVDATSLGRVKAIYR